MGSCRLNRNIEKIGVMTYTSRIRYLVSVDGIVIPFNEITLLSLSKFKTPEFLAFWLKCEHTIDSTVYEDCSTIYVKTVNDEYHVIRLNADVNKKQVFSFDCYAMDMRISDLVATEWTIMLMQNNRYSAPLNKKVFE